MERLVDEQGVGNYKVTTKSFSFAFSEKILEVVVKAITTII